MTGQGRNADSKTRPARSSVPGWDRTCFRRSHIRISEILKPFERRTHKRIDHEANQRGTDRNLRSPIQYHREGRHQDRPCADAQREAALRTTVAGNVDSVIRSIDNLDTLKRYLGAALQPAEALTTNGLTKPLHSRDGDSAPYAESMPTARAALRSRRS
jgi:hypothetical protein